MSEPYRPSNGTEGEGFMESYCFRCVKDRNEDCPILANALCFGIEDPEYPKEWIWADGCGSCTAFVEDEDQEWPNSKFLTDEEKAAQLGLFA